MSKLKTISVVAFAAALALIINPATHAATTCNVPGDRPTRVTLDSEMGLWQVADQDPGQDGVQTTVTTQATFVLVAPPLPGRTIVRVTENTAWGEEIVDTFETASMLVGALAAEFSIATERVELDIRMHRSTDGTRH